MKPFFINVLSEGITADKKIFNGFDFHTDQSLYEKKDTDGIPSIYNFMYEFVKGLPKDRLIVTFSPDPTISTGTICGLAEKYMYQVYEQNTMVYKSNLKVIYLTATPHISTNMDNYNDCILSVCMCETSTTTTKHKLIMQPDNFILVGLNQYLSDDADMDYINQTNITYFDLRQIRKKGICKIINHICMLVAENPTHIIFDLGCMNLSTAPCVIRNSMGEKSNIGFDLDEANMIMDLLSNLNIVGLDIVGYDTRISETDIAFRITSETAKIPLRKILKLKEKKINIFNQSSRFLIWRPIEKISETDMGWLILRGIELDLREKLLQQIDIDSIITITTTDDDGNMVDVYISATTMEEQESKSIYDTYSIMDCCLLPSEKINMMFELLSTPTNFIPTD